LAETFSDCNSWEYDVLAAGASGDLGCIVGIEHKTAAIGGGSPKPYSLRVTTILRREADNWRQIHRHGDPHDPAGQAAAAALKSFGS
jgi:ketosteroid isomerase-like protein